MVLLGKDSVFSFLIFIAITGLCCSEAAVYKVGDSAGWSNVGHVDYKIWSSTKNFQVGDTIVFEYNKQFHDVVRVTHKNFNACNSTGAYETFSSGNDAFVIKKAGHFYFICSLPGHCQSGQRVDFRVVGKASAISPSPTSPPIATPPTQPPTIPAPSPVPTPIATPQPPKAAAPSPILCHTPPSHTPPPQSPAPPTSTPPPPSSPAPKSSPPMSYPAPAPAPTSDSSSLLHSFKLLMVLPILAFGCFGAGP